jgi:hypothetical protein
MMSGIAISIFLTAAAKADDWFKWAKKKSSIFSIGSPVLMYVFVAITRFGIYPIYYPFDTYAIAMFHPVTTEAAEIGQIHFITSLAKTL